MPVVQAKPAHIESESVVRYKRYVPSVAQDPKSQAILQALGEVICKLGPQAGAVKVLFIKLLRELTNWGLYDAKVWVEAMMDMDKIQKDLMPPKSGMRTGMSEGDPLLGLLLLSALSGEVGGPVSDEALKGMGLPPMPKEVRDILNGGPPKRTSLGDLLKEQLGDVNHQHRL